MLTLKIPENLDAALRAACERRHMPKSAGQARAFIAELLAWARVSTTGHDDALRALDWPMPDFEDALQAAAALACGAAYIITRNGRDFLGSPVPAITPEELLTLYPAV